MDNKEIVQAEAAPKEDSIFSADEFSMQGYDKHIRQARNAIFFVAVILLINVIFLVATYPAGAEYMWVDLLIWGAFIAGFVFLGFYCKKKPYFAIVGALCLYGLFIALNAYLDITTLYKGIIMKIIVIVLLVKAVNDAKEAQEMQKNFNVQP
ncbi:MAG: hypothetical protein EOO06_10020 [Chitinophagaceae bacterium]|nr:MAG: hypothetical protein EOO06_10020 [Chitinophagaceae bacterium]